MTDRNSVLESCPFCGSPGSLFQKRPWSEHWRVCCDTDGNDCPAFGDYETRDKAITAWNRRTPVEPVLPETRSGDTSKLSSPSSVGRGGGGK